MLKRICLLAAVASITTSAQTFTTLASFDVTNGQSPEFLTRIQGINGDLYGVTPFGGASGYGTVFKVSLDGTLTTLYSLANDGDGDGPMGGLVQTADGVFSAAARRIAASHRRQLLRRD